MPKRIEMTRKQLDRALELWERDMRDDVSNRYLNDVTRTKQPADECAKDLGDWFLYWLERAKREGRAARA